MLNPNLLAAAPVSFAMNLVENCSEHLLEIDKKVRWYATELHDTKLLAKMAMGDLRAINADYHTKCLVGLYNRFRRICKHSETDTSQNHWKVLLLGN